jgi:hypothetical protein
LLDVLAKRELDRRRGLGEFERLGQSAPAELDRLALATNRVGGTMEDVRRRHAARQLAVDIHVRRVDEIANPHLGRDRLRRLVDASIGRHVRMAIDQTRGQMTSAAIDDDRARRGRHCGAHGFYPPIPHQYRRVVQDSSRPACPNRRILKEHRRRPLGLLFPPKGAEWIDDRK